MKVFIVLALSLLSFVFGLVFSHITSSLATRSDQPELVFFSMSFCPQTNQATLSLQAVSNLLKDSFVFTPRYLFKKITNPNQYLNQKDYLKSASGVYYTSAHGRQEANQNVREICAWNQLQDDKSPWWNFITNVNKNCTHENADICWEQQGKEAGLNTNKITECFNKEAFDLIEKEITISTQLKITQAPTVIINGNFLPQSAYSPEAIKKHLCNSMKTPPPECKTILSTSNTSDPPNSSCNN